MHHHAIRFSTDDFSAGSVATACDCMDGCVQGNAVCCSVMALDTLIMVQCARFPHHYSGLGDRGLGSLDASHQHNGTRLSMQRSPNMPVSVRHYDAGERLDTTRPCQNVPFVTWPFEPVAGTSARLMPCSRASARTAGEAAPALFEDIWSAAWLTGCGCCPCIPYASDIGQRTSYPHICTWLSKC